MSKKFKPYAKLEHWLFTVSGYGADMHAYVIVDDVNRIQEGVMNRLMDEAEKHMGRIIVPIILSTKLSTGKDIIYKLFTAEFPDAKASVDNVKEGRADFHMTVWSMPSDRPVNRQLMDLH